MDLRFEDYKKDVEQFQKKTEEFCNKEVTMQEYKGFSGRYGSYAQRGGDKSMLRLRLSGGRISKKQLGFIADCIQNEKIDKVHFTTCQTVQLHNLVPQEVSRLVLDAWEYGIVTLGGGGDYPRNVMVSPLSGVEPGEYLDVMPYAEKVVEYLFTLINEVKLPRKLKVGFANSFLNQTHASFRDLGFVAQENGTFDVYSAGGLGNNPKMGVCVGQNVQPSQILYYVQAMVTMFMTHGNYENRGKARTRYMQDKLGEEGYVEEFGRILKELFDSGKNLDLVVDLADARVTKTGNGSTITGSRVTAQKQEGLYAVYYHPIGGTPCVDIFRRILDVIGSMDQVELRITPNQGIYIINCTGNEAKKVLEATADSAENLFESSVACIGASVCQVGVRDSQNLLKTLVEEMRKQGFADGVLPQIHISGCPSSCGTHQIGTIGFHGGVKMIDKVAHPAFTMHLNGCDIYGKERFGENQGVILEENIPAFLIELGEAVEDAGTTFAQWHTDHEAEFKKIAEEYLI